MSPEQADPAYLWDMLRYARGVTEAVEGIGLEAYRQDENLRLAVERRIEIIGEAARQVSDTFQRQHSAIPWRSIIGQRHALAHDYGEIDDERIWRVATTHIPLLITTLEPLLPPPPDLQNT